jgi:hypothetical protein
MTWFIALFDTARDYTLHFTATHSHQFPLPRLQCRCLVAASNGGHSPTSGFQTVIGLSYQRLTATAHNWTAATESNQGLVRLTYYLTGTVCYSLYHSLSSTLRMFMFLCRVNLTQSLLLLFTNSSLHSLSDPVHQLSPSSLTSQFNSALPPHQPTLSCPVYKILARIAQKTVPLLLFTSRCLVTAVEQLLISLSLPINEDCACDVCDRPRFPSLWLDSHGDYSPTAPSLRPLVPNGSLIRCEPVQVYHHHSYSMAVLLTSLLSFRRGLTPPQCPVTRLTQPSRRPDYSLFNIQLYGLPEEPARCPLLPQT